MHPGETDDLHRAVHTGAVHRGTVTTASTRGIHGCDPFLLFWFVNVVHSGNIRKVILVFISQVNVIKISASSEIHDSSSFAK